MERKGDELNNHKKRLEKAIISLTESSARVKDMANDLIEEFDIAFEKNEQSKETRDIQKAATILESAESHLEIASKYLSSLKKIEGWG